MNDLTYAEIKKKLKAPIDKKFISHKTQGGAKIAFVNITDIKDILDTRTEGGHWEAVIKNLLTAGDDLVMIVSLIIHASDGAFIQDGTGVEKLSLRGYGDIASNAYAQGLRRAAESHGLGRELWRDELSDEQKEIVRESAQPTLADRIKNAKAAIENLGGIYVPIKAGETEKEHLESLTDQYKKLKETKK